VPEFEVFFYNSKCLRLGSRKSSRSRESKFASFASLLSIDQPKALRRDDITRGIASSPKVEIPRDLIFVAHFIISLSSKKALRQSGYGHFAHRRTPVGRRSGSRATCVPTRLGQKVGWQLASNWTRSKIRWRLERIGFSKSISVLSHLTVPNPEIQNPPTRPDSAAPTTPQGRETSHRVGHCRPKVSCLSGARARGRATKPASRCATSRAVRPGGPRRWRGAPRFRRAAFRGQRSRR